MPCQKPGSDRKRSTKDLRMLYRSPLRNARSALEGGPDLSAVIVGTYTECLNHPRMLGDDMIQGMA
jgi:hypothetical protein